MKGRSHAVTSLLAALALLLAAPAAGVLIASGDGTGNTRSPRPDLPWQHVGRRGEFSAIYLGHRWALTAAHVGAWGVEFAGRDYAPIDRSVTTVVNRDGSPSDLIAFRIDARTAGTSAAPPLPLLPIARTRPAPGRALILVGNGYDRGEAIGWIGATGDTHRGWRPASSRRLRWGTNRLDAAPDEITFRGITTRVLAMTFTPPRAPDATPYEAQAVKGDSGGAVFVREQGRFVLAGIIIVRSEHAGQPEGAALFGNRTYAVDLSAYRDQLVALTRPDCADERDNDDDGAVDFPDDPSCIRPGSNSEQGRARGPGPLP
ncbi:MAG: hypothetical protein VX681_16720 [Myxococcota bacterium]|nr:hypothetical protein [Myxococcota bacterium]